MKHAKKLLTLTLALVLLLSLSITAFAEQQGTLEGGSITIENAVEGHKYEIYQILYLESYIYDSTTDEGQFVFRANSRWEEWLRNMRDFVEFDSQGYVTWVDGADAAEFARAAKGYASSELVDGTVIASGDTVTFKDLRLGYYLVDTTVGTLCALNTTKPGIIIAEKNSEPENKKQVQEDSNGQYRGWNDAEIGQTVNFKSTIILPPGSAHVEYHDLMSDGLTLNDADGEIKVYTDEEMTEELDPRCYSVNFNDPDCTFRVIFHQEYLDSLTEPMTLYVKYSAVLNDMAITYDDIFDKRGNTNTSKLIYGDDGYIQETPVSTTTTFTYEIELFKYTKKGDEEVPLRGVGFNLYELVVDEYGQPVLNDFGEEQLLPIGDGDTFYTDGYGKLKFYGLDSGIYYLFETVTPDGYNNLAGPIKVKIEFLADIYNATPYSFKVSYYNYTGNPESPYNYEPSGEGTIRVENKSGTELPSTGGMGTTIFYVVGSILLVGAAVLLITKKRMSAAQ